MLIVSTVIESLSVRVLSVEEGTQRIEGRQRASSAAGSVVLRGGLVWACAVRSRLREWLAISCHTYMALAVYQPLK